MSDIILDGPRAYAVTLADELVCVDIFTGKENWKISSGVVNDDFIATANPALSGEKVFFGGIDGTVLSLDVKSGRVIWKQRLGFRISTSLAISTTTYTQALSPGACTDCRRAPGKFCPSMDWTLCHRESWS